MMAKWRDIPGWEGLYQISDEGVVKRVDGKARKRGWRVLRYSPQMLARDPAGCVGEVVEALGNG